MLKGPLKEGQSDLGQGAYGLGVVSTGSLSQKLIWMSAYPEDSGFGSAGTAAIRP